MYLSDVYFRLLGDPVESAFSLLFLDLEGDALDGSALDALDEMCGESCDFVPEALGGDLGDL